MWGARLVVLAGKVKEDSHELRPIRDKAVSQGNSILSRRNSQCKGPEARCEHGTARKLVYKE